MKWIAALTQEKANQSMQQNRYVHVHLYMQRNVVSNKSGISIQQKVLGTIDLLTNFVGFNFYINILITINNCILNIFGLSGMVTLVVP